LIQASCRLIDVTAEDRSTASSFFKKPMTIFTRWVISPKPAEVWLPVVGFVAHGPSSLVQGSPPVGTVTGRRIRRVFHLAAFELFNTIKFFAVGFIKASHVIPRSFAFTPALLVERTPYVFIVTILISIRVILWTTALCMFNLI